MLRPRRGIQCPVPHSSDGIVCVVQVLACASADERRRWVDGLRARVAHWRQLRASEQVAVSSSSRRSSQGGELASPLASHDSPAPLSSSHSSPAPPSSHDSPAPPSSHASPAPPSSHASPAPLSPRGSPAQGRQLGAPAEHPSPAESRPPPVKPPVKKSWADAEEDDDELPPRSWAWE